MNLQSDLTDPEYRSSLLVEKSAYHEWQNLTLAGRQTREALLQLGSLGHLQSSLSIPSDRSVDYFGQVRLTEWLDQKVDRTEPDCVYSDGMSP